MRAIESPFLIWNVPDKKGGLYWHTFYVGFNIPHEYTLSLIHIYALGKIPVGKAVHPWKWRSQRLGESGGTAAKRGTGPVSYTHLSEANGTALSDGGSGMQRDAVRP